MIRHSTQAHGKSSNHVANDIRPYDPKSIASTPQSARPNEVLTEFEYQNQVKFRVIKGDNKPKSLPKKLPTLPRQPKPKDICQVIQSNKKLTKPSATISKAPANIASITTDPTPSHTTEDTMSSGMNPVNHHKPSEGVLCTPPIPTTDSTVHSDNILSLYLGDEPSNSVSSKPPATISEPSLSPNPILGFDASGHLVTLQPAPHTSSRDPRLHPGDTGSPKLQRIVPVSSTNESKDEPKTDTDNHELTT